MDLYHEWNLHPDFPPPLPCEGDAIFLGGSRGVIRKVERPLNGLGEISTRITVCFPSASKPRLPGERLSNHDPEKFIFPPKIVPHLSADKAADLLIELLRKPPRPGTSRALYEKSGRDELIKALQERLTKEAIAVSIPSVQSCKE